MYRVRSFQTTTSRSLDCNFGGMGAMRPGPLRWHLREHEEPRMASQGQPTAGCARGFAEVKEALPKLRSHRSVGFT
jgi:hypothetical protein